MITVAARMNIAPGRKERFLESCRRMTIIAAAEPATLTYEYHIDEPSGRAIVLERYIDAASMDAHIANVGAEAARGAENYEVAGIDICGPISAATRKMFTAHYGSQPSIALTFYDFAMSKESLGR